MRGGGDGVAVKGGGGDVAERSGRGAVEERGAVEGGGGGGGARRQQSLRPCSRPPKLNNHTSVDHSLHPTWSKILLRNRGLLSNACLSMAVDCTTEFTPIATVK